MRVSALNRGKLERVDALLSQWAGNEEAFEAACRRNYGVERALSRDCYFPPTHSLANLLGPAVLQVSAGDVLAMTRGSARSTCVCVDLRGESSQTSGSLPEAFHVEGKLWGSELMLEGVLRCLREIRGKVVFLAVFEMCRKPWF